MSEADILVLGGPATGKTHYAGQLLGRLRHDRSGSLCLCPGGADDLGKFDEVLHCLEEGRSAGHTSGTTWTGMKCQLKTRMGNEFVLEWPEYAGERLNSVIDTRTLTSEWRKSISVARAWMLFIRPSILKLHEDLLSRPSGLNPKHTTKEECKVAENAWDDRARYVELLQMLLFAAGLSTYGRLVRPRLAIILTCWDELDGESSPESVFGDRLPPLQAFVRSSWAEDSWSVWGLSSLGRSLQKEIPDNDFVEQGPEKFGWVIPPGTTEKNPDLTAPLAWLLGI
jgi:hypothetical protein